MFALIWVAAFSQAGAQAALPSDEVAMRPPYLLDRSALDRDGLNVGSLPLIDTAGTAIVRLDVDAGGKLQGCRVTDWAGTGKSNVAMQRLICDGLRLKARFLPALDASGRPRAGSLEIGVDPQLPDEPDLTNLAEVFRFDQIPDDALKGVTRPAVLVTVAVDADGKAASCRIRQSSGSTALDDATCAMIAQKGKFTPAHDPSGKAIKADYTAGVRWGIPGSAPARKKRADGGTRASGDLVSLFTANDYPADAMRQKQQGAVSVSVAITPQGKVSRCDVLESSGFASLDTATCKVIQERARYAPAQDAAGHAVPDFDETVVRWVLPEFRRPFVDHSERLILTVDKHGKVQGCKFANPQMPLAMLGTDCAGWSAGFPAGISAEMVAGRTVIVEHGFRVGGPEAAGDVGRQPGERLLDRGGASLTIAADGTVTDCASPGNGDTAMNEAGCKLSMMKQFEALPLTATDRSDRHGVEYMAIYLPAPGR